jgi:5-methylcytosine-specific restriction endonuclease McrA
VNLFKTPVCVAILLEAALAVPASARQVFGVSRRTRRLLRAAAESDATFERQDVRGRGYLVGKCIHCQTRVSVPLDPDETAHATLEHIVPRHHGGSDDAENLAVACPRCNQAKGKRLDGRRRDDPTLERVIALLQERRRARLRA